MFTGHSLRIPCVVESLEVRSLLSAAVVELPGALAESGTMAQVGDVYYYGRDAVYRTDGTLQGTALIRDFTAAGEGPLGSFAAVDDVVYFAAKQQTQLWRTDGTPEGTSLVREVGAVGGTDWIAIEGMMTANHVLFFNVGAKLWTSDGTEAGTHVFLDADGGEISRAQEFAAIGESAFFATLAPPTGWQVWKTDGTSAGTVRLGTPLATLMPPQGFTQFGQSIYFMGQWNVLWRTDGTPEGTVAVAANGAPSPNNTELTEFNGRLYYLVTDESHASSLWTSDGTAEGTQFVQAIPGGQALGLMAHNGALYIRAQSASGDVLWKTDGTPAGLVRVKAMPDGATIGRMAVSDGMLFLAVHLTDDQTGRGPVQMWQSDGTPEGTLAAGQNIAAPPVVAAALAKTSRRRMSADVAASEPIVQVFGRKLFVQLDDAQGQPHLFATELSVSLPPLMITGTRTADQLHLSQKGDWLSYALNGRRQRVHRSLFSTIQIRTSAGNDRILIGPGVTGVEADAGPGNDILIGTETSLALDGGAGHDLVIARQRRSTLMGSAGNDILVAAGNDPRDGGTGTNRIFAKRLPDLAVLTSPAALFRLPTRTSPAGLFKSALEPLLQRRR